jgi:hypothetical protein
VLMAAVDAATRLETAGERFFEGDVEN